MQWILRFRTYIIIIMAVVLIAVAVAFSVLRAVVPHAIGYKNEVQQQISQQIGLPVKVGSIDVDIHWFSPRLKLLNVVVSDEKNKTTIFKFDEVFVELDVLSSVYRQELIVDNVGLIGGDLSIERISEGEWTLQGISLSGKGESGLPEQFLYILINSNYLLHDSNIRFRDYTKNNLSVDLLDVNVDVKNSFNNHEVKLSTSLPDSYGRDFSLVASFSGDVESLEGDVYIEANRIKVKQWNKKFNLLENYQLDAILDVALWFDFDGGELQSLYSQFESETFYIKNKLTKENWSTDFLSSKIRYFTDGNKWSLTISDLLFGEKLTSDWSQSVNLFISDDGESYQLSSNFLRFTDAYNVIDVFLDKEMLSNTRKIKTYGISSDIYNLNLQLPKDISSENLLSELSIDMTFMDFSIKNYKEQFNVSGLDGSLNFTNSKSILDLDSQDAEIEIIDLFRGPLHVDFMQGRIFIDKKTDGWRVLSDEIKINNTAINTSTRLDIQFLSGGILSDMHTRFYDGNARYVSDYLPVGIMSSGLVDWLDSTVNDGDVIEGDFILRGNLNDFPFDNNDGVFQVTFSAENVNLSFLESWPELQNVSANLKFDKKTLNVKDVYGKTQGAKIVNSSVVIKDLTNALLEITVNAESTDENIQSYIWNSPLDETLGDAMRLFQVKGDNKLHLDMQLPITDQASKISTEGQVKFLNSSIYYPELGYEIKNITGVLDFTDDSVFSDSLHGKIDENRVAINAITEKLSGINKMMFNINGFLSADYLLQRYEVPNNWFSGKSHWSIDIEVPANPQETLVRITVNTNLEGLAIKMSDKLYKAKDKALDFITVIDLIDEESFHVEASVRHDVDNDVEVLSENIFEFYTLRKASKEWDFVMKSDFVSGKGVFKEGLSRESSFKFDIDSVDLDALFSSRDQYDVGGLKPSDIPSLDIKAKTLVWDKKILNDIEVITDWHKQGMLINKFSLKVASANFDARGTWLTSWRDSQETVIEGTIKGEDLGETLTALGLEKSIDQGEYNAEFKAVWFAEPYALSLDSVEGEVLFEMYKGQLVDVDPGSGARFLGLFNIFKLGNRLVFDFDDITSDGFSFDSIKGELKFNNGEGKLKSFDVSASAADVNMFGGIDLINQDYDLLMTVKPHTDSLTFAGGAMLGGVAVGVGLALIQKIFDFGIVVPDVYSITGAWDEPDVEKMIKKTKEIDDGGDKGEDF